VSTRSEDGHSDQVAVIVRSQEASVAPLRQRRSIAEKRRVVEETLAPGASVARVARVHGINANQVFGWRRLYLAGRLGQPKPGIKLLPVRVSESQPAASRSSLLPTLSDRNAARFTSSFVRHRCGLKAAPMQPWCGCCWSACAHDRVAGQHTDLDRGRSDRLAARFHGAERSVRFPGMCLCFEGGGAI
jgi:transposase-like protein